MHLDHAMISGVQIATLPPSLGVVMTVVMNVYNPNSYDVAVRAMRGQAVLANAQPPLPINYQWPGDGLWLPAGVTTQMSVPVTVPVQLAIQIVQQAMTTPLIPYRITGKADVTATRTFKIEADDYSVDEQGTIPREQIQASIRGMFPFLPR